MCQKINLHTHSVFCDGNDTLEDLVQTAISKNFTALGFSSHSLYPNARSWHMKKQDFENYTNEICALKKKYESKIKLQLGFEVDFFSSSKPDIKNYEKLFGANYIIGAVHYVETQNGFYSVDNSTDIVKENLLKLYPSKKVTVENKLPLDTEKLFDYVDGKTAVCQYFETQRKMLQTCNFDILAHPDLIRKRNGALGFFVENEDWYINELELTAKEISKNGAIVEINTGGVARGVMDDFYPSHLFLQMLFKNKVPVCINSDCHNKDFLDFGFEKAAMQAKKVGYSELTYPIDKKLVHIKL